jgi:hypothetical protein
MEMRKKNHKTKFCVAAILTILAQSAYSTTYLVGPQRTITRLQDVTSRLEPGDSVFVDGNATYTGGVQFTEAGTKAKPIVVKGVRINDKRPLITGGTNTVHFNGCNHFVFEGFEVTGGSSRGIFHQADSVTVRDVAVHDCPKQGILGADVGSGTLILEYSEVYKCGSGGSNHQIYMTTDQVNFPGRVFRMQYCYLHDASGGNNVKSRSERNEIYYNWIEGAYYHELELIGPDPDGVDDGWTIGLKREDSDVVGNVLCKRRTAAGNDTNFAVSRCGGDATGWTHGRYRFVNNTIIAGSGAVFRLFDTLESIEMHNNIFYRSSGVVNMIRAVEGDEMAWSTGKAIFAGSNNWVVTGSTNIPKEWTGTITGSSPGFINFKGNDLGLTSTSQCLNAGTAECKSPVGFPFTNPLTEPSGVPPMAKIPVVGETYKRPENGVIDIGAFEHSSGATFSQKTKNPGLHTPLCVIAQAKGTLELRLTIAAPGNISLRLYSLSGKLIKSKIMSIPNAGTHFVVWDGIEKQNDINGIYLIEMFNQGVRRAASKVRI